MKGLSISVKKLETLPNEIGKLTGLERVNLTGCNIRELPESFYELVNLREVRMGAVGEKVDPSPNAIVITSRNRLEYLSPKIANLLSLEVLDLHYNDIRSLPKEILLLKKLKKLDLRDNYLPSQLNPILKTLHPKNILTEYFRETLTEIESQKDFFTWYNENFKTVDIPLDKMGAEAAKEKEVNLFISYSHKDSDFVRKLVADLQEVKLNIHIDSDKLRYGDNITEFIENGIESTGFTLSVVSKHSLLSPWVVIESLETFYREKVQGNKKLIPIFIDHTFSDHDFQVQVIDSIDQSLDELLQYVYSGSVDPSIPVY